MKVVLDPTVFADAVTWVARYAAGVTPGASPLRQIYTGVHLTVAGATLALRATDGAAAARVEVEAAVAGEGVAVLPARLLAEIAGRLPKGIVSLEVDRGVATLACGGLTLRLQTLDPASYPAASALPPSFGAVQAPELRAALRRTSPGVGEDKQPPQFRAYGVLAGPSLRIAATDRARIAVADLPWQPELGHDEGVAVLVPPALGAVVVPGLPGEGEVTLHADRRRFGVSWPGHQVALPLIDARMAPYGTFLATALAPGLGVEVDAKELAAALDRVGALVVRGSAGQIVETIEVDYDGPELELRVTLAFLAQAVRSTGGERIRLHLPSSSPDANQHRMLALARVGEVGYLHVVMLMRRVAADTHDPWAARTTTGRRVA